MAPHVYRLNSVTYYTEFALFLAIRTHHQVAQNKVDAFSLAAKAFERNTFGSNIITATKSIKIVLVPKTQRISLLVKIGIELREC